MKMKTVATHLNVPRGLIALTDNLPTTYGASYPELAKYLLRFTASEINALKPNIPNGCLSDLVPMLLTEYESRNEKIQISFRKSKCLEEALCNITGINDFASAVTVALCSVYQYQANTKPKSIIFPDRPLLPVQGNKRWSKEFFTDMLMQLPERITKSVDVFGGSGFLSTLAYASNKFNNCVYNDDDMDKQNFFTVISKAPYDFKCACLYNDIDTLITTDISKDERSILSATSFFIKSCKHEKWNLKDLDTLFAISDMFKHIKITGYDCLEVMKKNIGKSDSLLIVDPPYRRSRDYCRRNTLLDNKAFSDQKHDELESLLLKSKGIFIYFCRVTAPRDYKFGYQEIMPEDAYYRGIVENSFANKGLYCIDLPHNNFGTIERIITNYPFNGFSEFKFPNKDGNIHFF